MIPGTVTCILGGPKKRENMIEFFVSQDVKHVVKPYPMCATHEMCIVCTCVGFILLCTTIARVENRNRSPCEDFVSLMDYLSCIWSHSLIYITTHKHTTVSMHSLDYVLYSIWYQQIVHTGVCIHIVKEKYMYTLQIRHL